VLLTTTPGRMTRAVRLTDADSTPVGLQCQSQTHQSCSYLTQLSRAVDHSRVPKDLFQENFVSSGVTCHSPIFLSRRVTFLPSCHQRMLWAWSQHVTLT